MKAEVTIVTVPDHGHYDDQMVRHQCTLAHPKAGAITVSYGAGTSIVCQQVLEDHSPGTLLGYRDQIKAALKGDRSLWAAEGLNVAIARWKPRLEAVLTALLNDEASMRQHDHVVDWLDEFSYFSAGSKPSEIKRMMLAWDYHTAFVRPWLRTVYGQELEAAIEAAQEAW